MVINETIKKIDWKIVQVYTNEGVINNLYYLYKDGKIIGRLFRLWNNQINAFDVYFISKNKFTGEEEVIKLKDSYVSGTGHIDRSKIRNCNFINGHKIPISLIYKELSFS